MEKIKDSVNELFTLTSISFEVVSVRWDSQAQHGGPNKW